MPELKPRFASTAAITGTAYLIWPSPTTRMVSVISTAAASGTAMSRMRSPAPDIAGGGKYQTEPGILAVIWTAKAAASRS